ncbi:hypothetical protein VA7868_00778 [Vibrio aerogenes CECT 7868]|uniref:Uncharacterized protein n=1 Tax=Vibrio aerogenes CECT 7868 TaxID=1216006 RepID=A0A1M5WLD4_9VIBR|nr:hypothetical protein VA7868_00778 [Vibrio aerogenes CECT 7868]
MTESLINRESDLTPHDVILHNHYFSLFLLV